MRDSSESSRLAGLVDANSCKNSHQNCVKEVVVAEFQRCSFALELTSQTDVAQKQGFDWMSPFSAPTVTYGLTRKVGENMPFWFSVSTSNFCRSDFKLTQLTSINLF